jgi:hypothetical protein
VALAALSERAAASPDTAWLSAGLSAGRGMKSWPVRVVQHGALQLVTYNCENCKQGGFAVVGPNRKVVSDARGIAAAERWFERQRSFRARHPSALLMDTGLTFLGSEPVASGGQQFVFANMIADCEACAPYAAVRFAYRFDRAGVFTGARTLGFAPASVALHGTIPPGN